MKPPPVHRTKLFLLIILLIGLVFSPQAFSDTTVGGTISTDTTWTLSGSPYIVTSNITVQGTDGGDGITSLTIEPGVVVKLNPYIYINIGSSSGNPGALSAIGTAASPITFTSNQATPAPGDWYSIRFYNTTDDGTTVMDNCVVEYGAYSYGALYSDQASPTFRNITVQNSKTYGAYLKNAAPTIESCTFSDNQNYDLYYAGTVGGSVTGCTINSGIYLLATGTVNFTGNTINQNNAFPIKAYADNVGEMSASTFTNVDAASYLQVSGQTVSRDATWTAAIPYAITGSTTVKGTDGGDGITTLTIETGAVLKFNQYIFMDIGTSSGDPGALSAIGTAADPITFTSNKATPAPGDWQYIRFYNTADDDTTVLEHCVVEYGAFNNGAIYADQASPTFRNVNVQNSKTYGAYLKNAAPTIENCAFSGNQNYDLFYTGTVGGSVTGSTINSGIYLLATGTVDFSGNTINQNNAFPIKAYADNVGEISASTFTNVDAASYLQVSGQTVSRDATWTAAIPYAITNVTTVKGTDGGDGITTLTIESGAVLKFNQHTYMDIGASSGDPGALIAQGTTENQILFTSNQVTPAPGDWYFVRFYNTADDATTVMDNCVVEYGGYNYGSLYLDGGAPKILNTFVRYSKSAGIYSRYAGTSEAVINCNTLTNNQNGIYWTASPAPEMHNNNFTGNTNNGLYYSGAQTLNAEDNWWGDSAGPNQSGDNTYGNVDADPWSIQTNDCTGPVPNEPPNTPSNPTPADAAVRVSAAGGVAMNWVGGDPNLLDVVTYDLYLGTESGNLLLEATGLNGTAYTIDPATQGVTYFWQVIAKDDKGAETPGPVWRYTTDGDPPDLIVSQVTTDPSGNLQSGQSVTFTATVQNSGSGPVVDAFSVEFIVDGASIGNASVDQILLAGQTTQVSQTWTYTGGDPIVEVFADNQSQVTESNEDNNRFTASLSAISDNTAPSLVSSSPESGEYLQQIQQVTVTLADSQASVDDAAVIASFAITNSGQQSISGTITESDDTFTFVPNGLPLAESTYQVNVTAADTHGNTQNHTFGFTIDTTPPAKPTITGGTVTSGAIQPRPVLNTASQFVITLTGTREDGASVWINGIKQVASGNGDWITQVNLLLGTNAIEVWLQDLAGNTSLSQWVDIEAQAGSSIIYEYDSAGRTSRITQEQ